MADDQPKKALKQPERNQRSGPSRRPRDRVISRDDHGSTRPSDATAASAGGLFEDRSPGTRGPGRGTKSLGSRPGRPITAASGSPQRALGGTSAGAPRDTAQERIVDSRKGGGKSADAPTSPLARGNGPGGISGTGDQGPLETSATVAGSDAQVERDDVADVGQDAEQTTGRTSISDSAAPRLGAGGTGFRRGGSNRDGESAGAKRAKKLAIGGAAAAAPPMVGLMALMALMAWLKSTFFAMAAQAANLGALILQFLAGVAKTVAKPFGAIGGAVGQVTGAIFGAAVAATIAPVAAVGSGILSIATIAALIGSLVGGVLNQTALHDGQLGRGRANCTVDSRVLGGGAAGTGNLAPGTIPPQAVPWVENAAANSAQGIPAAFFAYIMDRETDFRPGLFAMDSNGGTWGLFQINAYEWNKITGGNFDSPDIRDPMVHTKYGARYFDDRLQTVRAMRAKNPTAAYSTQLTELEALMIAHNSGEGNLAKYPRLPSITLSYLAEFRQKFEAYGGGAPSNQPTNPASIVDTVKDAVGTVLGNCGAQNGPGGASAGLVDGGMNEEQASAWAKLYNEEGDRYLTERYGSGGPGACGSNKAMNCVSLSTYFLNKYTTFQQYAPGNGIQTASSLARMTGKPLQDTPVAYSIGSGPASTSAGHTFAVLGVQGDKVIVAEAGYCAYMGRMAIYSAADLKSKGWKFVDVTDLVKKDGGLPGPSA